MLREERKLRSFFSDAQQAKSFEELEGFFLSTISEVIPNENPCWNNWNPDASALQSVIALDCYNDTFATLFESLLETLPHHPLFHGKEYSEAVNFIKDEPGRISDQCPSYQWKDLNPLYREVYQYVDATHQIAFHFVRLNDRSINFTLNRPTHDFDNAEMEICKALGQGLAIVCKNLEQQIRLQDRVEILSKHLHSSLGLSSGEYLSPKETLALGQIFGATSIADAADRAGVSTHTFAKRLGSIREKLDLHNTQQLKALLRDFSQKQRAENCSNGNSNDQ